MIDLNSGARILSHECHICRALFAALAAPQHAGSAYRIAFSMEHDYEERRQSG
jgi:hypothetical protein